MFKVILIIIGIIIGSILGLSIVFLIDLAYSYFPRKIKKYPIVLVLGARVGPNNQPTKNMKNRLNLALQLLAPNGKIIVSGGQTHHAVVTEAFVMKKYLLEQGISEEQIIMEENAKNTYENFLFSKKLVGNEKVAVATSKYHVARSKVEAMKQHFKVDIYGATAAKEVMPRAQRIELMAILWKNRGFFFSLLGILTLIIIIFVLKGV